MKRIPAIALLLFAACARAQQPDGCFQAAAAKFSLDPQLLWSIAMVESHGLVGAVNETHRVRTNTVDLGIMQINSSWLPTLVKYGISRGMLMTNRCLNIEVGAWILAGSIAQHGATWNAVGAYNASCKQLSPDQCTGARKRYTSLVWKWYSNSAPTKMARAPQTEPPQMIVIDESSDIAAQ